MHPGQQARQQQLFQLCQAGQQLVQLGSLLLLLAVLFLLRLAGQRLVQLGSLLLLLAVLLLLLHPQAGHPGHAVWLLVLLLLLLCLHVHPYVVPHAAAAALLHSRLRLHLHQLCLQRLLPGEGHCYCQQ